MEAFAAQTGLGLRRICVEFVQLTSNLRRIARARVELTSIPSSLRRICVELLSKRADAVDVRTTNTSEIKSKNDHQMGLIATPRTENGPERSTEFTRTHPWRREGAPAPTTNRYRTNTVEFGTRFLTNLGLHDLPRNRPTVRPMASRWNSGKS